jgi:hypothetical protein
MTSSSVPPRNGGWIVPLAAGAAVFGLLQVLFWVTWDKWFRWQQVAQPWWLNSQKSILVTLVVVFGAAALVLSRRSARLASDAFLMLAGLILVMVLVLFVQGPGNLWPLVLGLGFALLALSVGLGAAAASAIRRLRRVEGGV